MPMSVLIKGGRIVTAADDYVGDVFIDNGTVSLLGQSLDVSADKVVDATGKYVIPGAIDPHTHLEMAFGGGALILAGLSLDARAWGRKLVGVGAVFVTLALIVFGVEHFLHPTVLPGVPLAKEMPTWIPGRVLIDYVTGVALLVAAGSVLLNRKTRTVARVTST